MGKLAANMTTTIQREIQVAENKIESCAAGANPVLPDLSSIESSIAQSVLSEQMVARLAQKLNCLLVTSDTKSRPDGSDNAVDTHAICETMKTWLDAEFKGELRD